MLEWAAGRAAAWPAEGSFISRKFLVKVTCTLADRQSNWGWVSTNVLGYPVFLCSRHADGSFSNSSYVRLKFTRPSYRL